MQEEIEQKSFNIMISTTKLSARTVLRAVKAAFRMYQSKAFQGKQSVRTLLRQNRGVSSVEISKTGIRGLERYAKKYGIDYAIRKDSSEVPPRYLVFFKAPDALSISGCSVWVKLQKLQPTFRSTSPMSRRSVTAMAATSSLTDRTPSRHEKRATVGVTSRSAARSSMAFPKSMKLCCSLCRQAFPVN